MNDEIKGTEADEILSNIERENVEAGNPNRFQGFYSPDWSRE